MLWWSGLLYRGGAALQTTGNRVLYCMIMTYAFGFNMLASYNLQSTFSGFSFYDPKVSPWIIGGILAVLTDGVCLAAVAYCKGDIDDCAGDGTCIYRDCADCGYHQYPQCAGNVPTHF